MEEYSSVHGCEAYESPELRVVGVVRGGFLSASEPHLVGFVGGESFGIDNNSWGGLDGSVGPESFGVDGSQWGGLGGSVGSESFGIDGGLDYGGFSGGLSGESFGVGGGQWGGLGIGAEALIMGDGASYGGLGSGGSQVEGLSSEADGWTWGNPE